MEAEILRLVLCLLRDLEQGKETVRMDKVDQTLAMFGTKAVPGRTDERRKGSEQEKSRV